MDGFVIVDGDGGGGWSDDRVSGGWGEGKDDGFIGLRGGVIDGGDGDCDGGFADGERGGEGGGRKV